MNNCSKANCIIQHDAITECNLTPEECPYYSEKVDYFNELTQKIVEIAVEEADKFIFDTISPFCNGVAKREISKKDLELAIKYWIANGRPKSW